MHKVTVLPGDGIGPTVMEAAIPIIKALELPLDLTYADFGWTCWLNEANPVPDKTWELIESSDATLVGAITSFPRQQALDALPPHLKKMNPEYISPLVQIRQRLDLFANIRPCFSVKGKKLFNFCLLRENTEGLYSGFDYETLPKEMKELIKKDAAWSSKLNEPISCTLRLQSQSSLKRLFAFAFEYALKKGYSSVLFADKPNVLRNSSAMASHCFYDIAQDYSSVHADIVNVDAVAMHMVTKPEKFGLIVAENMFGDILSDVGAGVMGGLGLAPSANLGQRHGYFEPVHGSGLNMASVKPNPSAMFFSIAMMLEYLDLTLESQIIHQAVLDVIEQGAYITPDLGGQSTTSDMAKAIIEHAHKKN